MNTIHISIKAYNAEATLARAIDSVLGQTYKNFVLYVCDNGSTDGTRAIVKEYAGKGLIKAYYNDENFVYEGKSVEFRDLNQHIADDDFYAELDADDELYPEFFEKLINFAVENDLDIAEAGYDLYDLQTNTKNTYQHFSDNKTAIFFEKPEDYRNEFHQLHNYSWTIWGKLFRGNVSGELIYTIANFGLGHDSASVIKAITKARRVGILPEQLMLYYVGSGNSVTSKYDEKRIYMPEAMFKITENLLLKKLQTSTADNFIYSNCYNIYLMQVTITQNQILNMPINTDIKLRDITYLLSSEICRKYYRDNDYFKLIATIRFTEDVFYLPLEWIYKNLKFIQPPRVREMYHLFFDVIYSAKEPKLSEAEIDFLLQFDIRIINSILCGAFEAPGKWLQNLPESEMRNGVLGKIRMYLKNIKN
jgi:glycosyltransferase involved in cell wall biosynthesis